MESPNYSLTRDARQAYDKKFNIINLVDNELKIDKLLPECGQYFKTNMNMQTMMELVNAVMRSDIVKTMDLSDSLIEEFRIPEDGTYSYGEDSTGSSVVKLNNKQATTESLHEFIYGAYYPAN